MFYIKNNTRSQKLKNDQERCDGRSRVDHVELIISKLKVYIFMDEVGRLQRTDGKLRKALADA